MSQQVENLKGERKYMEAGALAAREGNPRYYGCHYGMRSTRGTAESEFFAGYDAAKAEQSKPKPKARKYFTLIVWDSEMSQWCDEFGSYSRRECESNRDFAYDHLPRAHVKIIGHDDTSAAMIAARDAVSAPKGKKNAR
jgi:hypothetical protein